MTTLRIEPRSLTGTLRVPSSKSMGHRALVCAALAQGSSQVEGVSVSRDILATCDCLRQLGAVITAGKRRGAGRLSPWKARVLTRWGRKWTAGNPGPPSGS